MFEHPYWNPANVFKKTVQTSLPCEKHASPKTCKLTNIIEKPCVREHSMVSDNYNLDCKFCKRWQCHLCKKMQIDFLDFFGLFLKTQKNYAHVFFIFFEKIKSLWSPWSHHDFFGKSPKDFSFLDIFKMSKNKNPTSYSKYMKNEIWVLKVSNTFSPYMVTRLTTCWIFPYWLAQLIRNLLGTC